MRLIPDHVWAGLTIRAEARGEPYEGQLGVGELIRRRMARRYSSDGTVVGTVLRAFQWSCWNTEDRQRLVSAALDDTDPAYLMALQAWRDSETSRVVPDAVLYLNPDAVTRMPAWAVPEKFLRAIAHHHFYRS